VVYRRFLSGKEEGGNIIAYLMVSFVQWFVPRIQSSIKLPLKCCLIIGPGSIDPDHILTFFLHKKGNNCIEIPGN
jgi:hypothetical protein